MSQISGNLDIFQLSAEELDIANMERCKLRSEKSNHQRTQEDADRQWPAKEGDKRFRVHVLRHSPKAKGLVPETAFQQLNVWASDEDEAFLRYMRINGIRGHPSEPSRLVSRVIDPDTEAPAPSWWPDRHPNAAGQMVKA